MPCEVFQEYLSDRRGFWTPEAYSLFDNNCNNFSDEVANFLVGTGIPVPPPFQSYTPSACRCLCDCAGVCDVWVDLAGRSYISRLSVGVRIAQ